MAKRVSTDEKLSKIIAFLNSTDTFYNIKELESRLSKECGIGSMLVPDLIKNLLDENLISMEKCGNTNVYWCFSNQKKHLYSCETEKAALTIEALKEECEKKRRQLEKIKVSTKPSPERNALYQEYNRLKEVVMAIGEKRKQAKDCPYGEFNKLKKEIEEMKRKISVQTDNIFTLQAFASNRFNIPRKDFNISFNVPEEMEEF